MKNYKNRRLIASYTSVVIIMSIVLFLLGLFGIFFITSNSIINSFKEKLTISVFFNENAKEIDITQFKNEVLMSDYISNLKYISKEDAVLIMKEDYGDDFIKDLGYNPLVNSADIALRNQYVTSYKIDSISKIIEQKDFVDEVIYDKDLINMINENIAKVTFWFIPIISFLILITFLIINSSIRLSIFSKRELIKTMQLVGAEKSFIRKPFIKTNLVLSLISSIISIILISFVIYYLNLNIDVIENINLNLIYILFISLVIFGFTISFFSTYFATQNILKIKSESLDV
jgi:cell division transport system permease protein|tara:strand:- start:3 stop:866 length:864 start_codon:yes stop_codon:yes gene_type:complete